MISKKVKTFANPASQKIVLKFLTKPLDFDDMYDIMRIKP